MKGLRGFLEGILAIPHLKFTQSADYMLLALTCDAAVSFYVVISVAAWIRDISVCCSVSSCAGSYDKAVV